jgi:hypothetical protein
MSGTNANDANGAGGASTKGHRVVAVLLVGAAIAGALALVALRLHFQPPTVPAYAVQGATPGSKLVVAQNRDLRLDLVPAAPVQGAVAARGFLLRGDEVRPWDPPFSVDRGGAVHLSGRGDALFAGVPEGDWEIAIAVGRPEVLPTAPRDVLRARGSDPQRSPAAAEPEAGWRLVRQPIVLGGLLLDVSGDHAPTPEPLHVPSP